MKGEEELFAEMTDGLIDRGVPALDGLSPREAAARPEMRARLVRMMKAHVRRGDTSRREKGLDVDFNDSLGELGLDELIQPPPPLGDRPASARQELPAPPPDRSEMSDDEFVKRIKRAATDKAFFNRESRRHDRLLDAVEELVGEDFADSELELLRSAARFAILVLHPSPPPGFRPRPERMMEWYYRMLEPLWGDETIEAHLERITAASGHPRLVKQITSLMIASVETVGEGLDDDHAFEFVTALSALVREISYWPWK